MVPIRMGDLALTLQIARYLVYTPRLLVLQLSPGPEPERLLSVHRRVLSRESVKVTQGHTEAI